MRKLFRCFVFVAASAAVAAPAAAGELTVKIGDGRATVIAKDVPLRDILAEWARVGNTRLVNAEKLLGGPISLELVDMPEKEVLDILLRSAAGYMTGPRPAGVPGASLYDRVMILATSRPPPTTYTPAPSPFPRTMQAPPQPPPEDDDDGEPGDQGPNAPPGMFQNPGVPYPGAPPQAPQTLPTPGQTPPVQNPNMPPGALPPGAVPPGAIPPGDEPQATPPGTAPRPGMIPAQPQPNPYGPFARPPGTTAPDDDR